MESLKRILVAHPFFSGLGEERLALIVGCASNVRFKEGEYLFREGDESESFYLIREGRLALELVSPQKGRVTIETIGAGEVVGWSWLLPPYRWRSDARAATPVRAIALDGVCLRGKCEEDPQFGYEIMKRFASVMEQRLIDARLQLMDLYGADD
jgi:CRP/FNR family cyclic AMP-dependent transcriptional regulator